MKYVRESSKGERLGRTKDLYKRRRESMRKEGELGVRVHVVASFSRGGQEDKGGRSIESLLPVFKDCDVRKPRRFREWLLLRTRNDGYCLPSIKKV